MSAGFHTMCRRLQPVLPDQTRNVADDVEYLLEVLRAFFFTNVKDDIDRDQRFTGFVIPSALHAVQVHFATDAHRVRFNEYLYSQLDTAFATPADREDAVLGLLAALIESGSVPDHVLEPQFITDLVYDIFPGVEQFLAPIAPDSALFRTVSVDLTSLANYLDSIQVFT